MRARNIKPDFFIDEDVTALPLETRLFFIGLWCAADREGRLEDRPKRLKSVIMPNDSVDGEAMVGALVACGLLRRYEVNNQKLLLITGFKRHQSPHGTERASVLPPPLDVEPPPVNREPTVNPPLEHGEKPSGFTDSLIPGFTDSQSKTPGCANAQPAPQGAVETPEPALELDGPDPSDPTEPDPPFGWDEFAAEYPPFRLNHTKRAMTWFRQHVKTRKRLDEVLESVRAWKASEQWAKGVVPNCGNFCTEGTWKCPPPPPALVPFARGRPDLHTANMTAAAEAIRNIEARANP